MYYSLRDNARTSSNILNVLKAQLQSNRMAEEDRQQLAEYLATKDANACAT